MTWRDEQKALLETAFMAGVTAAHPDAFLAQGNVRSALRGAIAQTQGRVVVLGAGKASAAMARALEREWRTAGGGKVEGLVVTRAAYEAETGDIGIVTGGHPFPESQSARIAERMLAMATELGEEDLLIGLWSGGGSALLACPPEQLGFEKFLTLTKSLLVSGASIHEVNTVRKHLSKISGGRLARAAAPARLLNLVIPDVAGGDEAARLSAIASGPGVPDPTRTDQAREILTRYGLGDVSDALIETPKSWGEIGVRAHQTIVMDEQCALEAAAAFLAEKGFRPHHVDGVVTGEARKTAASHVGLTRPAIASDNRACFVTGGELTVTVRGKGKGGPNQEFALALALKLEGRQNVAALAGDTDGIDGIGGAAGAFVFPDTLERMRAAGIDPEAALQNNDAGSAFEAIGDLLVTGPTLTNVNDLRLIVING